MKNLLIFFAFLILCPMPSAAATSLPAAATSLVDSLRRLAPTLQGKDRHFVLARIARATNEIADWDSVIANARTQQDTVSLSMGVTNRIICLSNQAPIDLLQTEVGKALSFLRSSRQFNYYFHTYRVYINTLFTARQHKEAQQAATDMFEAARQEKQPLGMAMAMQVQGSMYYQLDLYPKAMDALEEAYRVCPAYTSEINTLVTHALICEWLCMTALKLEDTGKLTTYADRYHENVEYRNEIRLGDPSGHFPVTAAAFRAQAMLRSGRQEEARALLDHALTFMRPGIPARAYEHYYEARCEQLYRQADYTGALIAIDTLLNTHQGYFPFYLHDLLRKAEILAHQGKGVESTRLYSRYIAMQDSIERIEIAARMDKLQTLYEVDRLKTEQRNSFLWFVIAAGSCTLTLIIFAGYIVYSRRLHRKNRILYQRYLEQEKMEERVLDAIEVLPINSLSKEAQLFCQLSELMHEQKLFTNPNLKRKELADLLHTNETYLANAIRTNTDGKNFHDYITDLRLKYASRLLIENDSLSVAEVGEKSGFNSSSTYFRVFRERFGMSPTYFRSISKEK